MRLIALSVFAVAAGASALGGAGLVVVPHDEPPGADPMHQHRVTVHRFPILLAGDAPGVPRGEELAHHVRSAHAGHLRALLGLDTAGVSEVHPLAELAGGAILALLVALAPGVARPTRRAVAEMPLPTIVTAQWRACVVAPPPRVRVVLCASR